MRCGGSRTRAGRVDGRLRASCATVGCSTSEVTAAGRGGLAVVTDDRARRPPTPADTRLPQRVQNRGAPPPGLRLARINRNAGRERVTDELALLLLALAGATP